MAVLIYQTTTIAGKVHRIPTFESVTAYVDKQAREAAKKLDEVLVNEIGALVESYQRGKVGDRASIRLAYAIGGVLRHMLETPRLVDPHDVDSGLFWLAARQYMTHDIIPRAEKTRDENQARRVGHKNDYLDFCVQLASQRWDDVAWIKRWSDWIAIAESPGILRDERVFLKLAHLLGKRQQPLSRPEFRKLLKHLRQAFPTKVHRDSEVLSDDEVERLVVSAFKDAGIGV